MLSYRSSYDDNEPLFFARGYPVYVTVLLVALHVFALIATSLLMAFGYGTFVERLTFSSAAVIYRWELWRYVTYAFCHAPSLWFLLDMYLLYIFGREVERFFGRSGFLKFYAALLLIPPLVLTAGELLGIHTYYEGGSDTLHFALFVAFVCINPNVQFWLVQISAKWWAIGLAAILTLLDVATHNWQHLTMLWAGIAVAFLGTRLAGIGDGFSFLQRLQHPFPKKATVARPSQIKPRVKPRRVVEAVAASKDVSSRSVGSSGAGDVHESIDPLLEKISKHGIGSLSASERATLERARASLLRKDRGS